ncbi:MAG: PocR ligand-binding domain-containing protein [Butyrivibrio sp.]|nr:PocR ligand-binding domain-containing protein [Acetatifactor muris]MCM1559323.1 PocR ligand-binding domain-containing protein [Butyrivibrio sp.]
MEEILHLTDLISVETLQRVQDAFSAMTGMAALTTDADGVPVTKGSNFTDFCMKYARQSKDGHIRCEQCDKFGAEDSWKEGGPTTYYCHAGLIDYAAPILADGQMVGSFIGGQVLTEPPKKEQIFKIAWDLGVRPQDLWEAAQKVRILEKKEIDKAAEFLFIVANVLSDMAYGQYRSIQGTREIERANNMKSDFLANMSHEIRTPMNAVIGMAEMALREKLPPAAREYVRQIKSSGKALLTIINDILDFSKIEAGKMDIVPVEYEPMSIVNDIATIAEERLKDKEVELVLDISPEIPSRLLGDNIRIKQILLNIVNNATKFTTTGQVMVRMFHERKEDGKVLLCFAVEDTGIGIKEEDLTRIFNSFQQVDSKRNRNIEGTGLGLAISRQLTHLMDGEIHVKSQYGKGTMFSFEIPQTLINAESSISVKNPENILVYGLIKNEYLKQNLVADCQRFGVEYHEISSMEEVEIPEGRECFLFAERELLTPLIEEFVQNTPALTAAFLFPFQSLEGHYNAPNIHMVRKPLYSMNEAMIFNHERLRSLDEDADVVEFNFIAPDAEVLIVDDNAINLTVAEGLLEPLQMKVDLALSGKEAITKISEHRYDIIFMDHMMPELDGVETTHIIRRFHPEYNDVPIIALTANAMSGTREVFLEEGMNDFIAKPVELKMLISKVAQWLPAEKIVRTDISALDLAKENKQEKQDKVKVGNLDTETAIGMLGSEKLFWAVLKDFYRVIEKKCKQIKDAEKSEDWSAYTIEVHALKSAARQIGAIPLSEKAAALEDAGNRKDGAMIHARTDEMLLEYMAYIPVLSPFCEEQETRGGKGEIPKETLQKLFADMRIAMDELDMDRMEEAAGAMKEYSYSGRQAELFERLLEAVENIDVDTCEEIMVEWEETI